MASIILTPVPLDTLLQSLRTIIKEELKAEQVSELHEKFLSPAEVCSMFQPKITKPTLASWEKASLLEKYSIGHRTFYKYSDVLEAVKHLKKYKTKGQ